MATDSSKLLLMPIERRDGTYVLRLGLTQGELNLADLQHITAVMTKYNLPSLCSTTGQRMNIEGVPADKLDEITAALGVSVEKAPPGVSVCPGAAQCKLGQQRTREIGKKILALVKENGPYPYKVKSGVSGCKTACAMSYVRDIGLLGGPKGWDVMFGGGATRNAGPGVVLGTGLSSEEALELLRKALIFYRENGKKRERTRATIARLGEDALLDALK